MSDHAISQFPMNVTACYCTGACRQPGGVCPNAHTVTVQQGWRCVGCGNQWSPYVVQCPQCAPRRLADCGCQPYSTCMNASCPRRIRVTS